MEHDDGRLAFGQLLRRYRLAAPLTQEALAERAGLSVRGIADLERGTRRHPHRNTIERLANALQLTETAGAVLVAAGLRIGTHEGRSGDAAHEPTQVRAPIGPLLGREAMLPAIVDLVRSADGRLVTLVGPGGVGKTRLALELGLLLHDSFSGGVVFIDLVPVRDAVLVLATIAQRAGVREAGNLPLSETLARAFRDKELLLVLDNFEQVLDAGSQIADLLEACSRLRVLITSREPLRVRRERVYPVPPLGLPDLASLLPLDRLVQAPSVALFVQRAQAVLPAFCLTAENTHQVAELCIRLDGLPLAIELAAARSRALPPQSILARIERRLDVLTAGPRDQPQRHQSLRAALAWSHDLLAPEEQVVFRRLSVFAGGSTLEAAEALCADQRISSDAVLDIIIRLVDKSLVLAEEQAQSVRYRLLETVQQYGAERLAEAGETIVMGDRHRDWYLSLAERTRPEAFDPGHLAWVDQEYANLRAALRWCMQRDAAGAGLRLGAACWNWWYVRGNYSEGRAWLVDLLDMPDAVGGSTARSAALNWGGHLALSQGDYAAAQVLVDEARVLAERLGDDHNLALALQFLGNIWRDRGDLAATRALEQSALRINRRLGNRYLEAVNLVIEAEAACEQGDIDGADSLGAESLAIFEECDHTWGIAYALRILGRAAASRGNHAVAHDLLQDSLALQRELGFKQGILRALTALAQSALNQGNFRQAWSLFVESLQLANESGDRLALIRCLEGLAALMADDPASALRLAGAATGLRKSLGVARYAEESRQFEHLLRVARIRLGKAAGSQALADGHALPLDSAIALALEEPGLPPDNVELRGSPSPSAARGLTDRQIEVAALIGQGRTNREIANQLVVSERTAEHHVENILTKLGLSSRTQVGIWAVEHGLTATAPLP